MPITGVKRAEHPDLERHPRKKSTRRDRGQRCEKVLPRRGDQVKRKSEKRRNVLPQTRPVEQRQGGLEKTYDQEGENHLLGKDLSSTKRPFHKKKKQEDINGI